MKKTRVLLVSVTVLLLASRNTKRAMIQRKPVQDNKVAQQTAPATKDNRMQNVVVMQRVAGNAPYQKNLVSNLTLTLNDEHEDTTVPGILRIRKDGVIRLQLLIPVPRSEVWRIEFAEDYVLFIDHIHKRYAKASYDEVGFLRDNGISSYSLQSLFWSQVFIPRQQKVSKADLSQFTVDESRTQIEDSTLISLKDGKMDCRWLVNPKSNQIILATATYNSNTHGTSKLSRSYDDFKAFGSKLFPASQVPTINTSKSGQKPTKTLKASFDLESLGDANGWGVSTTPSGKHTKVGVEGILGGLVNF